jgi:hypothetical protein
VGQGSSDGYYEDAGKGQLILAGSRSPPGTLIGVGPGLCGLLPRIPYRRSSQNSSSKLSEKSRTGSAMVALEASETTFWSPYTAQIHSRSVARTSFQTVSPGTWVNKGKRKGQGDAADARPAANKGRRRFSQDASASSSCLYLGYRVAGAGRTSARPP